MHKEENKKFGNILVVEDDHIDTLVVKALLEKHFNLQIVQNGHEAIKIMDEHNFDIVLADINLGDVNMDGIKLMKTIRENKLHDSIKVFAVTSYYENRNFFIEQGFDELLTKPVIKEEILDILNASMNSKTTLA
ncbi:MAG: response regulator [Bacteroidota bacterium]